MDSVRRNAQTLRMKVRCHASVVLPCPPEVAYARVVDADGFAALFVGFGPIPAVREVRLDAPLAPGSTRRVHNSDGSVLLERITALDPPCRHAYVLSGFSAPFSWLVTRGDADWCITRIDTGTRVDWQYEFALTHALAYPVAAPLLGIFMRGAMRRCLANLARSVAPTPAAA